MKLREYLEKNERSVMWFARKINVSVNTMYNIFKGKDILLSIALRIEKFTDGEVSLKDLISQGNSIKDQKKREDKEC